jgi:glycopeptide antibiotics resistance protein
MDQPIFKNLEVDEISGNYFKTASKWALFISIVYIACILLLTVMLLTNSDKINTTYNEVMTTQQVDLAIGAIIAILIIAFAIILVIT